MQGDGQSTQPLHEQDSQFGFIIAAANYPQHVLGLHFGGRAWLPVNFSS
jgi:hypothetical protein